MRPSPFTGKFKKRQIKLQKDKHDQNQQQFIEENKRQERQNQNSLRPPPSNNIINKSKQKQKSKDKKNVYDALKEEQDTQKIQSKPSTSFKPNLKLKAGKKIKLSTNQVPTQIKKQEEPEQPSYRPILKPNLFKKGQTVHSERNINREEVIVEQQQKNHNIQQDSYEGSGSQSISIAPKFKIKAKQQNHFPVIQEQPMQQTGFGATNFADIKIQTRQININPSEIRVSQVKIQKQHNRVKQLSKLLNLQIDLYEQTLNISCVTPYEIYINKIKNGSLVNSGDQAFDQKSAYASQTATLQYQDYMNQCPQDYHTDAMNIVQKDQTQSFNKFLHKIAPVLQQLIKPSTTVVMPPIFLLALRPQFRKLVSCPFPVFVYYSNALHLGIVVIGEKLYITQNQIQTVLSLGNHLIAGAKDGTIYIWTGRNDKGSKLYKKIIELTQTTNFQLPEYSTRQLDRFSIYRTDSPIVGLLYEQNDAFTSLDSNCKMIKWRIERGNNKGTKLTPFISYQFSNMIQRPNLIGYSLHKRNQTYFICSSGGVIVWNGEQIIQRLDTEGFKIKNLALPHRTNFIYTACEDSSIRIFQQHYSNQLLKLHLPGNEEITSIIVPQIEYQNKKLSLNSIIYIIKADGSISSINFLKNATQAKLLSGGPEKRQRDVIYRGVNKLSNGFQLINLWKDLKCTSEMKKMDVNTEPSVNNIKNILEQNKKLHSWLESEHALTIIQ